ncbi:MAG: hypothetical protein U1F34_05240 [Gammaproteobacteria bacterium]
MAKLAEGYPPIRASMKLTVSVPLLTEPGAVEPLAEVGAVAAAKP